MQKAQATSLPKLMVLSQVRQHAEKLLLKMVIAKTPNPETVTTDILNLFAGQFMWVQQTAVSVPCMSQVCHVKSMRNVWLATVSGITGYCTTRAGYQVTWIDK